MNTRFKPKCNIKKGDTVVVIAGDGKENGGGSESGGTQKLDRLSL